MNDDQTPSTDPLDRSRMTVGEHLEELRTCVVRSLIALVVAAVAFIWPARYLLEWIVRPAVLALRRHGQPDALLQTSPTELITIYFKVVIIAGVIVASPYILWQFWRFVAAGLYPHEKRWVTRLFPFSVGLFFFGVAFMYAVVLLVSLNFLVGFSGWIPLPDPKPNAWERAVLRQSVPGSPEGQPTIEAAPQAPLLAEDPLDPPAGRIWFNLREQKLKLRGPNETYSVDLLRDRHRAIATTHFKIGDYLTFVLTMTVAFGVAFQMPLVVMALVRTGIVPIEQFRKGRKFVVLVILVLAGLLAPPEIVSHMLLSVPMILLFELGLLLGARSLRKARAREAQ